jgi:hypothetical protein
MNLAGVGAHPAITSKFEQITCCRPERVHTGSGQRWWHRRDCAEYPNQKMRDTHPELFQGPPTARVAPLQPHAACRAAFADGGTPCSRCAPLLSPTDYDLHHSDAAPDWGPV